MLTSYPLRGVVVSILLKQEENVARQRRAKGYILVVNAWNKGKQVTITDRYLYASNNRLQVFKAGDGWSTVLYRIRVYPNRRRN